MLFRSRQGGDVFLVVDLTENMLYLYKTVETMLRPTIAACVEQGDRPFFWAQATGMMYVLSQVSCRSYEDIQHGYSAEEILWELESSLEKA